MSITMCRSARATARAAVPFALAAASAPAPALAQEAVVRVLAIEGGDTIATPLGDVDFLRAHGCAVNGSGGYAALLTGDLDGRPVDLVWGGLTGHTPGALAVEDAGLAQRQSAFERAGAGGPALGLGNMMEVAYSAAVPRGGLRPVPDAPGFFDSLWLGDVPMAVEGDRFQDGSGRYWRYTSGPRLTRDGAIYFLGGTAEQEGGRTTRHGLWRRTTGGDFEELLGSGGAAGDDPRPLAAESPVRRFAVSGLGAHTLAVVAYDDLESRDEAVLLDGYPLETGSGIVAENERVTGTGTVLGTEKWDEFDWVGVSEADPAGWWAVAGTTTAAAGRNHLVVVSRILLAREGSLYGGRTLVGGPTQLAVNESGDLAMVWDALTGTGATAKTLQTLFVNGTKALAEGDPAGESAGHVWKLKSLPGLHAMAVTDRHVGTNVTGDSVHVYAPAVLCDEASPAVTARALLEIEVPLGSGIVCAADWDDNDVVNVADIFAFLSSWFAGTGDFNADGVNNVSDIFAFLSAWFAPCA